MLRLIFAMILVLGVVGLLASYTQWRGIQIVLINALVAPRDQFHAASRINHCGSKNKEPIRCV